MARRRESKTEREGSTTSGGVFTDRSGRVHQIGGKGGGASEAPPKIAAKISAKIVKNQESRGARGARQAEDSDEADEKAAIRLKIIAEKLAARSGGAPKPPGGRAGGGPSSIKMPFDPELRRAESKKKTKEVQKKKVLVTPRVVERGWDRNRDKVKDRDRDRKKFKGKKGPGRDQARGPWQEGGKDQKSGRYAKGEKTHGKPLAGKYSRGANQTLKATVDKNRKGFGFLIFENRKIEDAFIAPRHAETLFHGDRVEVILNGEGHIQDLRVLEHRFREVVGRYQPHPSPRTKGGWVIYERKRAREEIFVPEGAQASEGDWVRAKLEFHESGPHGVTAQVVNVYGPELPASADIEMVAAEYNLIENHPDDSEAEAKSFTLKMDDPPWRVDLRKVPFITIDGETARDFDDAVYVEPSKSGYTLWVAIADVSSYVTKGSALDRDARSRGTSVYFPERAFHMLPRALSENLCSLKPNEPRLAMVSKIEFDQSGKKLSTELMEAVIDSKRRATYNEIEAEWIANKSNPEWEFANHFALYQKLRKMRSGRGSIDFDLPEAELKVQPDGVPISITLRARLDAHRLIEEFMIAANEAVTEWALERVWPFLYRIHDEPAEQSLLKFQKLAYNVGVTFSLSSGDSIHETLADLVTRLEDHPAQTMLNQALLRSMKQAIYSSTHGGHFGLASRAYTHFTSPIRRYPDLVVHRMLRWALRVDQKKEKGLDEKSREQLEKELAEIAEHCSYRERLATDAERESIRLKQVRIMIPHLGEDFEGKVVGMVDSGLFVQIKEPFVEGLVSKETMMDDSYEFDAEKMVFIGRRKRRAFHIGDVMTIKVIKADIDRRQIEFQLIEEEPAPGPERVRKPKGRQISPR